MLIPRNKYLQELRSVMHNGMIKIVTGIRRCGKSYLLFELFKQSLLENGVNEEHIIQVDLEDRRNKHLREPDRLLDHIDGHITDNDMYYILLDEIQLVPEFEDVLNSYLKIKNTDVYVTGSNSRMLSSDVKTEFRGRGYEIRVHPLSFSEFLKAGQYTNELSALQDYMIYGGMPQVVSFSKKTEKENYLKSLFQGTYIRDIKERYNIRNDDDLSELIDIIASNIGCLTNPTNLENTFKSVKGHSISDTTIQSYLGMLQDAFMLEKAIRYDIKGKHYINTPSKYYFEDVEPAPGIMQLINQIEHKIFDNVSFAGPSWVPETASVNKGHLIMDNVTTISGQSSVGAAGDGSIELVTAFCEAAITGKPAPNLVEEAYYSSVLGLLGLQAIDEGRVITFPDEYKIPYLNFA